MGSAVVIGVVVDGVVAIRVGVVGVKVSVVVAVAVVVVVAV